MLPYGQAVQHAAKAGSPQHDIHVVMRLNAPSMALLPHFCTVLHGSIEKGGWKPEIQSRAFGAHIHQTFIYTNTP